MAQQLDMGRGSPLGRDPPLQNGNIYFRLEKELVSLSNCRHSAAQPDSRPGDQG